MILISKFFSKILQIWGFYDKIVDFTRTNGEESSVQSDAKSSAWLELRRAGWGWRWHGSYPFILFRFSPFRCLICVIKFMEMLNFMMICNAIHELISILIRRFYDEKYSAFKLMLRKSIGTLVLAGYIWFLVFFFG